MSCRRIFYGRGRMLARLGHIPLAFGILAAAPPSGTPRDNVPPSLRQTAACMLDVLKTTAGVASPKLGFSNSDSWVHPYLQYQYSDESGQKFVVRFDAQRSRRFDLDARWHDTYWFQAVLPGLMGPGERMPFDWGTREIARKWKTQCGATAIVLTE